MMGDWNEHDDDGPPSYEDATDPAPSAPYIKRIQRLESGLRQALAVLGEYMADRHPSHDRNILTALQAILDDKPDVR
jgi:hypothetical protein